MTLVDHWDVEDLKFRILSGSTIRRDLFLEVPIINNKIEFEALSKTKYGVDYQVEKHKNLCWIWQGNTSGKGNGAGRGYGRMKYRGESRAVHRLAYVCWNGPITPSKVVDHMCNNRLCCNPKHLQLVTQKKNIRLMHQRKKENA